MDKGLCAFASLPDMTGKTVADGAGGARSANRNLYFDVKCERLSHFLRGSPRIPHRSGSVCGDGKLVSGRACGIRLVYIALSHTNTIRAEFGATELAF